MKNPILSIIKEHKQAESSRKVEIHSELLKIVETMSKEEQAKLIRKLNTDGLSLILSCGIRGEVYALALKRLFNLRSKNERSKLK